MIYAVKTNMFPEDLFGYIPGISTTTMATKEWNGQKCKIKETSPEMLIYRFSNKKRLLKIQIISGS